MPSLRASRQRCGFVSGSAADGCFVSRADASARWEDRFGVVYTTNTHSAHAHAFVAVLPYSRPVSRTEHVRAVEGLARIALAQGRPFDLRARSPSRFVYLPGAIPGCAFDARTLAGTPISVKRE